MKIFKKVPLSALRVFEAAGRTCSFVEAAKELDLSSSAVSHAIRKLEVAAGVSLFTRSTRHTALTSEGSMLLDHVQRGFEEMSRGLAIATNEPAVPLRLHVAPTFASQWLVPRLAGFLHGHPGIDLRISASTDYARFDNDDFDLDIVYGEPRPSSHEKTPLRIEELTPLCSPEVARHLRSPQDLYSLFLIQSDGQSVQWKGWFAANGMQPPKSYGLAFDRSSMSISAAAGGLGVVLESDLLAEQELASGQLVSPLRHVSNSVRYVGHYLVHPRRHRQPHAVTQFKQWLFKELAVQ
ncbi:MULTISPECIES: LysR substrate-binding domain-containing protein [Pseudomonas]|uniref:LysR family transcriptional regulator n=4 Tax=Pseudomonas TaxID=286 RepID=A0A379KPM9_PSEPU|nr:MULTISPECIES: LysR substrate-binding domain-containing protein [Pseudomonas]MBG6128192.1 DNA-binding transcriptional LysR family regulator [Pseudomonas sp. M2]NSX19239.1 LysR family transcriptional regulator [Pseudomonas putida]QQE81631.1 LysR family transcriptional regulator [Pseudomonas putida]SUD69831.1 LysR family transcriptional regulator [Pseudomonas putida]GLH33973.1 HTH-type transcriptional regulator PerR [Pseudomonas sp. BR1R-5]